MNRLLLDTGPLVALLDRSDAAHALVTERLPETPVTLVTTGAVITECMFFLQDLPNGPEQLAAFLNAPCVERVDVFAPAALDICSRLMRRYADTPMDFADATLVFAATVLKLPGILTLDERGFRTYRFARNRAFRLFLQDKTA
jgi:predicted nucleic acid-binding protein